MADRKYIGEGFSISDLQVYPVQLKDNCQSVRCKILQSSYDVFTCRSEAWRCPKVANS